MYIIPHRNKLRENMRDKKSVGRPLMGKLPRLAVNALVKPSTIDILDAWGPSRGISIDNLVHAENKRRGGK